jgi:hypothetical protein
MSAALQEADALYARMVKDPGRDPSMTDDQVWLEAYAQATTAKNRDPMEAERNFYSGVLQKLLGSMMDPTPEDVRRAQDVAEQITESFRQRYNTRGFGLDTGRGDAAPGGGAPGARFGTQTPPESLPPDVAAMLREGKVSRFANGQAWTLQNGQPVRVQ